MVFTACVHRIRATLAEREDVEQATLRTHSGSKTNPHLKPFSGMYSCISVEVGDVWFGMAILIELEIIFLPSRSQKRLKMFEQIGSEYPLPPSPTVALPLLR